ncbi:conserved hypothetical protein [Lebetimonas natsushimae]|uniref:Alginate lyase 2 domain-containing protein n=1 Tax=Lebetimonas natsushimae TaxID=1936991 RepID=A0A292YDF1_9BACT|nr:polysaccharide lyase family 7 protein [Lebetimonas natsushimae]GAX87446.1 conserved hypothetical protein [Lebetimonas natsushimae]
MKKIIILISLIFNIIFAYTFNQEKNFSTKSPYCLDKFKFILNISKLQAPKSKFDSEYSTYYGKFEGIYNKYFYLENNNYMTFYICEKNENEHRRSELRFRNDFKVSENHYLKVRVKILPLNEKKEFTFLQIHADAHYDNTPNKPLLRVIWRKEYNGLKDHLWVIIRDSNENNVEYLKIDLGKRPENFFNIVVKVKESKLYVFLNGKKKVGIDVSFWKKYNNYFKAGVYLQGRGCAKVLFDKLWIK